MPPDVQQWLQRHPAAGSSWLDWPLVSRGEERYDAAGDVLGVDCVLGAHDEVEALPDPGVHQAQAPDCVVKG